ncbi:hypothetical protein MPTK1_2g23650 [Marchantia polymorpha subsp. ruderalis]|uniref:Plastid lipid-associated protein/fibrillin conserved domain-containing protein n=2 Tax=Marchantia polymorpha TaxID=3197 RepID=A0A176W316_MARPO|nr:hypothetical protein AXG93_4360s1260 [Marchantia polymorpha subsp. ruderalis]PTQ35666.1 hypothetical protein MARPO_0069s0014 [Marchantia polymorpha]BBN03461.1 hypothetical protein Mp_2g23650 [Marchantia polymorpha subsp. ruderalis]|eukprot:PTQ35666.1 hypothetical protein MARPO_0069s0014 [Marchantia polymorpha]
MTSMALVSSVAVSPGCCSGSGRGSENQVSVASFGRNCGSIFLKRWDPMSVMNSSRNTYFNGRMADSRNVWIPSSAESGRRSTETIKAVTSSTTPPTLAVPDDRVLQQSKYELLKLANETGRGLTASADQRAEIEEAMVGVEKFDAGKPLQLDDLDGTWLLQYTTAPDVVGILQAAQTPFLKVGQIFQKFECRGRLDGGSVKNVVRWSIPSILQEGDGATLVVDASFSVCSPRSIALRFEEAKLGDILISEELQGFIAPAVLPRSFFLLQILQFLRTLAIRVPLVRPPRPGGETTTSVPIGLRYYLTYLDRDMLVGRALGNGGIFIFSRTQRLELF